ncbi:MAG TPA: nitrilase-related carbon-nitrogen hydrolase [Thermoanaerobaculia bacterium]|jgi:N-carbamoylputrescine amidase|nr:nitrilase-related carbon-nitrogen hydrolase [Thermoanaerobaculia bacterium]
MRIALAQLSASPDRKANLVHALETMTAARAAGAELIAFPEVILDRFFPQNPGDKEAFDLAEPIPGPTTERIAARARELGLVTVFNLYELDDRGRRFDSSPVFDADGTLLGVTRMIHITDYEGFHEQDYYHPGDQGVPVYETRVGRIGVAICYDRHYPEVMRGLGVAGAELVVIPQAGTVGEWPEGLYEAEVRTAAFQNGYFAALANRVGVECRLHFSGESFAVDPEGRVIARGKSLEEDLVLADVDLSSCADSTARRLFWRDRRPELYRNWL